MPQRRTAKKELRKTVKKRQRNLQIKNQIKVTIKKLKKALEENDSKKTASAIKDVYKILDKAASKKIIHPNKAARKKSRIAKLTKAKK